ncbi:MAG: HAD-IA family hydrolase [Deltaproteobacteria bacterium]|nr:HAD-IA family hydrolase [Deltaproteobacteria bacterium]
MFKTELIIFDLDGTLIDSSEDIAWAVNKTLRSMGFKELSYEAIKKRIGWGVKMLLQNVLPEEKHDLMEEARTIFMGYYSANLLVKTKPYNGVTDVLEHFKNKKLAVATNKPLNLTERILGELNISNYFNKVVGGDGVQNKKPAPEAIEIILRELNVSPEIAVFIGDSKIDIEAGKTAGVVTIGAAYGFRGRQELEEAGADVIIEDIKELTSHLCR